jgi:hypothetical protein
MGEKVYQLGRACERPLDAFGSDDRGRRRHHCVWRIAPFARRIRCNQGRVADQIGLRRNGNVEHGAVILARDLVHERQREVGFERQEREVEH